MLADTGHTAFAEREVRRGVPERPPTRDRLALWGRRLFGEAVTQAQQIVAERDGSLRHRHRYRRPVGDRVPAQRVQFDHSKRMAKLGLN